MSAERVERRLAAILAADVAGYSRLMGLDEAGTLARLNALRCELIDPQVAEHKGRIVKTTGDGILIEFPSVVEAVACALAVQGGMALHNAPIAQDRRTEFRIGINTGDIIVEDGDIHGDGVNVAARLEALAEPGGVCVSAIVQGQVEGRLDCVFDDIGEQSLKNIARPVHVYRVGPTLTHPVASAPGSPLSRNAGEGAERMSLQPAVLTRGEVGEGRAAPPALALPDKPSIAVLPFQNMSGDPEQEYFVDGMVEEITTAIARLPWLFVIARNSSFTYKGKAVNVKQVGRELGVRYVLEGSVRKAGNRVRITGQLIDTTTGAHLWADRIDGALDNIFELQDQVASSVAGAIEPKLRLSEIERASHKPTESLDAYDLYLRAVSEKHKIAEEANREAVRLLQRALDIDPFYLPAAGLTAACRAFHIGQSWPPLADAEIAEAIRLARQVIESSKDDADALWMAGFALVLLAGELTTAAAAIDRALMQNPNSAHAWDAKGRVQCYLDQPDPAIDSFQRAMRLSPLDPLGYRFTDGLALAHLSAGRFEKAMEFLDQSLDVQPRFMGAIRRKVILCGLLGRLGEARGWLERLVEATPGMTVAGFSAYAAPFYSAQLRAICAEGLRRAGLPEE